MDEALTGKDYFILPFMELLTRSDFSIEALEKVIAISVMTSGELENIR